MPEYGFDYRKAPEDVIAERNALADRVCRELERAGIPAFREQQADRAGARVEVDDTALDAARGMIVDWRPDPSLTEAVVDSMQSGDYQAPVIQHNGAICSHMQKAIIGILRSAGLQADTAAEFDGDLYPLSVCVTTSR
ncbi:hypothetical protein [Streptomyces flaveus]|uniref:Uncharacterized protein n=1 Tax=Streptomyces flaveus TaxID=66370 RepID=A0A917VI99_9ACTN|nr:hypothetical protein [Streptomyces flaveus]GGK85958.1 hypothetical protein GCM10010094_53960 [Streptomyces flaveus]